MRGLGGAHPIEASSDIEYANRCLVCEIEIPIKVFLRDTDESPVVTATYNEDFAKVTILVERAVCLSLLDPMGLEEMEKLLTATMEICEKTNC